MYLNASSLSGIFLLKSETIGFPRFHLLLISFIFLQIVIVKLGFAICSLQLAKKVTR